MECLVLLLWLCLCNIYTGSAQDDPELMASEVNNNDIEKLHSRSSYTFQENHKPMFRDCNRYNPQVEEEQKPGTFIIRVEATDQDPPDKAGGRITYNIEEIKGVRAICSINATTGEIYTSYAYDRDEPSRQMELYLTVRAVDDGRPQLADICTFKITVLDINDNSPSFDQAEYRADVSEDLRENSEIIRVVAYDFDEGENARLTYSFTNSEGNFDEYFRIDPKTGVVYLKRQLIGKRGERYHSTIHVQDNGENQKMETAQIFVTVVDSNKKPPTIFFTNDQTITPGKDRTITLMENENDFSKPLITINAESNIDAKDVSFELVKGKTTQTNKDHTFALNPSGNEAIISLARRLDYETVTEYQLTIRAQNKDSLYASVTIIVKVEDVNDEIPTFIELLKGSVVENDVRGAQAMTVRAIDRDGTSPNNKVVYQLITFTELFEIDPITGVITAKGPFDREDKPIYFVTVQAKDSAPSSLFKDGRVNSANQTFQISIEDQNDNRPKFKQSPYVVYNVSESIDVGKTVIDVTAEDVDTASLIIYSITEGNEGDAFYIEEQTGRIKVNIKLDYEKIENYSLTVSAFDGLFNDTAQVIIYIHNENDEVPVFENYTKEIYVREEETRNDCIITLKAYDPDIKDRSADQKIVYQVGNDYKSFLSVTRDGCVTLIKPLDRDQPNGAPAYQAYITALDSDGGRNSLTTHAEIDIVLEDINDNAPMLNMTEVVWYENQDPGIIVHLTATDYDGPENGPPFKFEIPNSASVEIQDKFAIRGESLSASVRFDREEKKFYNVPIKITDSGKPPLSNISMLRVIIGDRNDNAAQDGVSEIFVYKYEELNQDIQIGRVYVNDPDDWDVGDKVFQPDGPLNEHFYLNATGMIVMRKDAIPQEYTLHFKVTEENEPVIPSHTVSAQVTVTVKQIPKEAVIKSGSIRLKGRTDGDSEEFTSEQIIQKDEHGQSRMRLLQQHLSRILNTSVDNVDVFTVMPSHNELIDVRFSAHGSPYYAPEKLNHKVTTEQEILEKELGVEFVMIGINECPGNCNSSCSNILKIENEPAVVSANQNQTSFVGVKAVATAVCECHRRIVAECFNGGTPIEGGAICNCLEGFEGPNCEILGISFAGDGWALYPPLDACAPTVISLNVLPQADDGLIFYAGPETGREATNSKQFIAVELREGNVVLKIDLGYGPEEIVSTYRKINDGAMHTIKINYTMVDVQLEVDECSSDCLRWKNFQQPGLLNIHGPLQVGGRPNLFPQEQAKMIWGNPPAQQGFKGCITNFTYNTNVYHLGAPSDSYHAHSHCNYGLFQAATFGIDSNFLIAILVCLAILLILLLAVVVHKRKQDNLNEKEMDDTRENIINYEDEGGGECDTNFDLSVLRNPDEKPPMKENLYRQGPDVPADIGSFLDDKKRACDKDNLPCDDVRHYGYEGDGNSTGSSLSSLASCTDEGDLKFNYLSSFGPRFRKLADMYGDDASDEVSQNGGEESWC